MRLNFTLLLSFLVFLCQGQSVLDNLTFEMLFRPDYFLTYKKIPLEWKQEGKIQVLVNEGLTNLSEGKFALAVGNFDEVIKVEGQSWQAYYYRGVCNRVIKDLKSSERDFEEAIKIHENFYEGYFELGKTLTMDNNLVDADARVSRCIQIDSLRPDAFLLLGDIFMRKNDFKGAQRNYLQCLKKDSAFHTARIKAGIIDAFQKKDLSAAIPSLNKVINIDSVNLEANVFRAILRFKTDPKSSLADINRAIRQAPTKTVFKYVRGLLLANSGDFDNAFTDLKIVMQEFRTDENNFIGRQSAIDKRIDLQQAGFYVVTKIHGLSDPDASLVKKAFCELLLGKNAESLNTISQIKKNGKIALCLYLAAVANEHSGNHEIAWALYSKALKYDNDILDAHKKIGIYCTNRQMWKESEKEFTEALRLNPNLIGLYNLRGVARFNKQDFKGASEDFSLCAQKDTLNYQALKNRINCSERLNDQVSINRDNARLEFLRTLEYKKIQSTVNEVIKKSDTVSAIKYLDQYSYYAKSIPGYVVKIRMLVKLREWKRLGFETNTAILLIQTDAIPYYSKQEYSYLSVIRGQYEMREKNEERALADFNNAIILDPTNSLAYLERGRLNYSAGRQQFAKLDLQKALELGQKEARELLDKIN